MEQLSLNAEVRPDQKASTLRRLRDMGQVPGVLYGTGQTPIPISVPAKLFSRGHGMGKGLVQLNVDGQVVDALIHDLQRDPVTKRLQHVDFYRVDMATPVDVRVPLHIHGMSDVERKGGIVQQQTREIEIRALPSQAPEFISVDVGHLGIGEHMTVRDIVLPPGVVVRSDINEVFVTVLAPKQVIDTETAGSAQAVQANTNR